MSKNIICDDTPMILRIFDKSLLQEQTSDLTSEQHQLVVLYLDAKKRQDSELAELEEQRQEKRKESKRKREEKVKQTPPDYDHETEGWGRCQKLQKNVIFKIKERRLGKDNKKQVTLVGEYKDPESGAVFKVCSFAKAVKSVTEEPAAKKKKSTKKQPTPVAAEPVQSSCLQAEYQDNNEASPPTSPAQPSNFRDVLRTATSTLQVGGEEDEESDQE